MSLFKYNYIFQLSLPEEGADKESLPLHTAAALSCPRSQVPLWDTTTTAWQQKTLTASHPQILFALTAHSEERSPRFHVHSAQSLSAVISLAPPLSPACRWLFRLITTESSSHQREQNSWCPPREGNSRVISLNWLTPPTHYCWLEQQNTE